jgi:hypothetical protein
VRVTPLLESERAKYVTFLEEWFLEEDDLDYLSMSDELEVEE